MRAALPTSLVLRLAWRTLVTTGGGSAPWPTAPISSFIPNSTLYGRPWGQHRSGPWPRGGDRRLSSPVECPRSQLGNGLGPTGVPTTRRPQRPRGYDRAPTTDDQVEEG